MSGTVYSNEGVLINNDDFVLVKKVGSKGDEIKKHNHPEAFVLFTVVNGKVEVTLNDEEKHILEPGKILNFDGNNHISAIFLEEGEAFVTLVKKNK